MNGISYRTSRECKSYFCALAAGRAHLLRTTVAASHQSGVSGAGQLENRLILVTSASLPQSIPYSGSLRDATLLAGWTGPVLGQGTGREREGGSLQHARNMLATSLQHACNHGTTTVLLRCCPGAARGPRLRSCSRNSHTPACPPLTSAPASGQCCDIRCRYGPLAGRSARDASHRTTARRRCSLARAGCL